MATLTDLGSNVVTGISASSCDAIDNSNMITSTGLSTSGYAPINNINTYSYTYPGGLLNQISVGDYAFMGNSDFEDRKQLVWDAITKEDLPEINQEELIKILDMIKSGDSESVVLGFRLLQGKRIPKGDFITELIMKDACSKLVYILHKDYYPNN